MTNADLATFAVRLGRQEHELTSIIERLTLVGALALAVAALALSLTHAGPAGRAGPAGPRGATGPAGTAGRNADPARYRYGVCWTDYTTTSGTVTWVTSVDIEPAQVVSGVYQCPQGETFVSIVPQPIPGLP